VPYGSERPRHSQRKRALANLDFEVIGGAVLGHAPKGRNPGRPDRIPPGRLLREIIQLAQTAQRKCAGEPFAPRERGASAPVPNDFIAPTAIGYELRESSAFEANRDVVSVQCRRSLRERTSVRGREKRPYLRPNRSHCAEQIAVPFRIRTLTN
jgi:hypothetical protein